MPFQFKKETEIKVMWKYIAMIVVISCVVKPITHPVFLFPTGVTERA